MTARLFIGFKPEDIIYGSLWRLLEPHEVPLHLGGRQRHPHLRRSSGELGRLAQVLVGEELGEHVQELVVAAVVDLLDEIHPARSDQSRVEPVEIVRGHEDDPTLGGRDAIDRVQEAAEGEPVGALIGRLRLRTELPADEGGIDVLQEDDGVLRGVRQAVGQPVVAHRAVAQVEHADAVLQLTCGQNEWLQVYFDMIIRE